MNTKECNPLFDQYGIYRREAIKMQREGRLQAFALACAAGVCISTITTCCWMLVAG